MRDKGRSPETTVATGKEVREPKTYLSLAIGQTIGLLSHVTHNAHGLGKGSTLPDGDDVPLLHFLPTGRAVHRHFLVALLELAVLRYVVKIIAADDVGVPHFARGDDKLLEDTVTDGNVASKRALLST